MLDILFMVFFGELYSSVFLKQKFFFKCMDRI